MVAHLDLDAFYASVELLRRPELRGRPLVVSGSGPRAVVTTCSYEARAFGVHSAMPTSRALRLCPQAVLIAPDFAAYRAASRAVWAIVGEHVDVVQRAGLDEGYLDLSQLAAPLAAMRRLVADVEARTGLGASVGIGPNRLVAKVASDCEKPAGMVAISREQACERFAGASPRLVPGIGPKTAERLAALQITTLAALRGAAPELLAAHFGANGAAALQRRARFEDDSAVVVDSELKSQSNERTFDVDIGDRAEQERALAELAEQLCEGLRRRRLMGRTIGIKVRLDDWTNVTRARTLERPTNDPATVRGLALELLRTYDPQRPVRLLGVRVAGFAALEAQGPSSSQLALDVG